MLLTTIDPDEMVRRLVWWPVDMKGLTVWPTDGGLNPGSTRDRIDCWITVALVGYEFERLNGQGPYVSAEDLLNDCGRESNLDHAECTICARRVQDRLREKLELGLHPFSVNDLFDACRYARRLKVGDCADCGRRVQELRVSAREKLAELSGAIDKVTAALVERRTLAKRDVEVLISLSGL